MDPQPPKKSNPILALIFSCMPFLKKHKLDNTQNEILDTVQDIIEEFQEQSKQNDQQ